MSLHPPTLTRAALPEILFVPDLAVVLGMTPDGARRAVLRGECGPFSRFGKRICVRREALLAAIEAREESDHPGLQIRALPRPEGLGGA